MRRVRLIGWIVLLVVLTPGGTHASSPSPTLNREAEALRTLRARSVAEFRAAQRRLLTIPRALVVEPLLVTYESRQFQLIDVYDMDGNSDEEILSFESTYQSRGVYQFTVSSEYIVDVVARDGNGQKLWSRGVDTTVVLWRTDFTGDGIPEIMTIQDRSVSELGSNTLIPRTLIEVVASADGSTLWSRLIEGTPRLLGFEPQRSDAVVVVEPMPDADGDGASDVFVGTLGSMSRLDERTVDSSKRDYTFTATALRGSDGQTGSSYSTTDSLRATCRSSCVVDGELPWAFAMGDVTGDGFADLVTTGASVGEEDRARATTFQGVEVWSKPVDGLLDVIAVELDGAGSADVISVEADRHRVEARRGSDGVELWARSDVYYYPTYLWLVAVVPDIDGDGGMETRWDTLAGNWARPRVETRSGRTGLDIWSLDGPAPTKDDWTFFALCGDMTGDGHPDISPYSLSARSALDGGDGSVVWSRAFPALRESCAFDDVDRDGTADLIALSDAFPGGVPVDVIASSGATGGAIWSTTVEVPPIEGLAERETYFGRPAAGDLDGDGLSDFVFEVIGYTTEFRQFQRVVAVGASGLHWVQ